MLSGFERALLAILILVLMTGMGATLTVEAFRGVLRRPKGVVIGLLSQFGWMPLIAFGLAAALDLAAPAMLGLLIVGCTPGGTTSNMFTYYARADLALSISMTAVSTVVAVVAMPLVLAGYAGARFDHGVDAPGFAIPYGNIVVTLLVVLVPVALGMWIRAKRPALAPRIERVGSLAGIGVLLLLVITGIARNTDVFAELTWQLYAATIGLSLAGITLGYGTAWALGLPVAQRRAVGLETGIQNSPLALGIIAASFTGVLADAMMVPVLMYALFVLAVSTVVTWVWRQSGDSQAAAPKKLNLG